MRRACAERLPLRLPRPIIIPFEIRKHNILGRRAGQRDGDKNKGEKAKFHGIGRRGEEGWFMKGSGPQGGMSARISQVNNIPVMADWSICHYRWCRELPTLTTGLRIVFHS